ncbi:MAG: hypothetical protein K8R92_02010 [Planctomycetes bacterium]|nr:hypothetical protein [Planctomycetota bacterium]
MQGKERQEFARDGTPDRTPKRSVITIAGVTVPSKKKSVRPTLGRTHLFNWKDLA